MILKAQLPDGTCHSYLLLFDDSPSCPTRHVLLTCLTFLTL